MLSTSSRMGMSACNALLILMYSACNVEYYVSSDQGFRAAPKSDALLAVLGVGLSICSIEPEVDAAVSAHEEELGGP